MAKKKRLSRKEIKQRQQAQKARIRQKRGWTPPPPGRTKSFSPEEDEALATLLSGDETAAMSQIMNIFLNSGEWIDEPEFADIFFSPMESMEMFASEFEKRGYLPQDIADFDQDEQDDLQIEVMQGIITQLLTKEKRQEIVAALDALSQRWRRLHKKKLANEVSLAKLFLTDFAQKMPEDIWQMVGLIQALTQRSIAAGFEIMEATSPLVAQADNDLSILDVVENLPAEVEKSAGKLLKRIPGLRRFLEKQSDEMWDEGLNAVYNGDLYLALFMEEELNGMAQIIQKFATLVNSGTQVDKISKKQQESLGHQIDEYIVGLMTPDRVAQLRTRIREIIQKEQVDRHWMPFVTLLHGYFREEEAVENERPFLFRAIMGELRIVSEQMINTTDEEE